MCLTAYGVTVTLISCKLNFMQQLSEWRICSVHTCRRRRVELPHRRFPCRSAASSQLLGPTPLMKYSLTFICWKGRRSVVVVVVVVLKTTTNKQINRQTAGLESDSHSWGPSPLWSPQVRSCCPTAIPIHTNYFKYRWRDREATHSQGKCDFRCISK